MKRLFFISISFLLGIAEVLAEGPGGGGAPGGGGRPGKIITFRNPIDSENFTQLANRLVDFLLILAVPISIIMVIWAGLLFMTAGGNPDRVDQGKNTLLWTAIGIGVLMISKSVTYLLENILRG